MKFSSIYALALACLAGDAMAAKRFEGISLRSSSPVHQLPVTGHDNKIWLGGKTKSFCPNVVEPNCPPGKITGFVSIDKSLYMNAEVAGGQEVYIANNGRLSYTIAHSGVIPEGSQTKPFGYVKGQNHQTGVLKFKGDGDGWTACKEGDIYAVFAPGFRPDCISFRFGTEPLKKITAWQYD